MKEDVTIGSNPLPIDAQEKLGELLDWLDANYELKMVQPHCSGIFHTKLGEIV